MRFLLALSLSIGSACVQPDPDQWDQAHRHGLRIVRGAVDRIGSLDEIAARGPFVVAATGTLDKAAEGQGYAPGRASPVAYREVLGFDFENERFAREYREDRYDGTVEWLRILHTPDRLRTWIVFPRRIAAPEKLSDPDEVARRLLRRLPHAMIDEIVRDSAKIRWLGRDSESDVVAASLSDGTRITIAIDTHGDPHLMQYEAALLVRGQITIAWRWSDWRDVDGRGRFPFRQTVTVDELPYLDLFVDSIATATNKIFEVPADVRTLPPPDDGDNGDLVAGDAHVLPPVELHEVARGVFTAHGVRSGFAPLVITLDSFSIAVDAPASFPLLAEIPAGETDPGPYIGWIGDRFVNAIREQLPDHPVRYVVLTHAHEDHIGGIRAFVKAGATILAPPGTRAEVERILNVPTKTGHARPGRTHQLRITTVRDSLTIAGSHRSVRILSIEPNPHHVELLAVLVDDVDLLFVSDLVTPAPLEHYPRANHVPLDIALLRWLDMQQLAPKRILAMHGNGEIGPDHIARLRTLFQTSTQPAGQ